LNDIFDHKDSPVNCCNQTLQTRFIDINNSAPIIYLHGWGTSHNVFYSLIESLFDEGRHIALDFPGFGNTDIPDTAWGTYEYAVFIQHFLHQLNVESCTVIGHSFGGRVAIQLAHNFPDLVDRIILIASAGIKRKVALRKRLRVKTIQTMARLAKSCIPGSFGENIKNQLYSKIASRDYLRAGEMKNIFVKVVNEDLGDIIPKIHIPALLLWGNEDTETPPEIGERIHQLLPNSHYIEFPGFDHYSILTRGSSQVSHHIRQFLKQ
jgi:pimeloyl-ACP methyl ester carboxylesterase